MSRARRHRRGAAVVELAVAMIVLIPIILYVLFLEDLLGHYLEWQEALVGPAWDFAANDYVKNTGTLNADVTTRANRFTFCDHTSAYDTFSHPNYDCNENENHHQALAAHACWVDGDDQVECRTAPGWSTGSVVDPGFHAVHAPGGGSPGGGLMSCTARLSVLNYFIFQKWASFGRVNVIDKDHLSGSVHAHTSSVNTWVFGRNAPDAFGVLFDTWALNAPTELDGNVTDLQHQLLARVGYFYALKGAPAFGKAATFFGKLSQDGLIGPLAALDGTGDLVATPAVAWKREHTREVAGHWASGWSDRRQQDSWAARTASYMGVDESVW